MSNQCKNCEVRGDYGQCISTECCHHENWISEQRINRIKELEDAIKSALRIKDLWTYGDVSPEYEGEAQALNSMLRKFEDVLK